MTLLQALILSIVEGITEFLPVSSTGHLVLTATVLHIQQTEFVKSFEIIIQLGAILAVIVLYGRSFLINKSLLFKVFAAFIPTAIVGFILYKIIKTMLLGNPTVTVVSLFVGGILMIGIELYHKNKVYPITDMSKLSYKQSLLIGLIQSVSVIPGVSRAAATILGSMFLGANRKVATEFSFLLALPTMIAASGLDILKTDFSFTQNDYVLLGVGFIGSFIVALLAIKFLLSFIKNHTFIPFGIYRIILSLLFWFFIIK